ncbi:MAG: VWA domain-containing protein [Planctomycetaceae bacterium]|nr:VWA domain-containing protein [Planctomycetaceae bacterium]
MQRCFSTFLLICVMTMGCVPKKEKHPDTAPMEPSHYDAPSKDFPTKGEVAEINGIPLKIVIAEDMPYYSVPNNSGTRMGTLGMFQILYVIDSPNRFTNGDEAEWLKVSQTRNATDAFWIQGKWDKNYFRWQHRVEWFPLKTSAVYQQDVYASLEVCVVLDVTGSMDEHFPTAQKAIREFAETFQAKNLEVWFKLTTYKDIDEIEVHPSERIVNFCNRINNLRSGGGGDPEESVYPALDETLTRVTFRERSERILLLVGDSPSHISGVNNPKRIGNSEIIRLANKNNVKVFVAAVAEGLDLEKQMRGIAEATGGKSIALTQKTELFRHIQKMLQETSNNVATYVQVASKFADGRSKDEIDKELGKDITPIVEILRNEKRIETDKLVALEKGETICTTGWIACPNNTATAGRLEVFGFKTEFEATLGVMQTIATLSPEHKSMFDIQIEGFGSRVRTDVPLGKFMDEHGLPHSNPSLLGMTMGEIMLLTEAQRASIKEALESKIKRLKDELNDKSRWRKLSPVDERLIGHVSESCLP